MLKKTIKISLKFFVFLIVLFIMGVFLWQVFNMSEKLRVTLINEVEQNYAEKIDIRKLDVNFTNIVINDVVVVSTDNMEFSAKIVKFSLNYLNLIKYGFDPKRIFSNVEIKNSIIKVYPSKKEEQKEVLPDREIPVTVIEEFQNIKKAVDFISKIDITGCDVFLSETDEVSKGLIYDLTGSLEFKPQEISSVTMQGRLFYPTNEKIKITGLISPESFSVFVLADNFHLSYANPVIEETPIEIENGVIETRLNFNYNPQEKLNLTGFINVSDVGLKFKNSDIRFSDINFMGIVQNNVLDLKPLNISYMNSDFEIKGKIRDLLKPDFDISIEGSGRLSEILEELNVTGLNIYTGFKLKVNIKNKIDNLKLDYSVKTDSLNLYGFSVKDVSVKGAIKDWIIDVRSLDGKIKDGDISGNGNIGIKNDDIFDLNLNLKGDFSSLAGIDNIIDTGKNSQIDFNLRREKGRFSGAGRLKFSILNQKQVKNLAGNIEFEKDDIKVTAITEDSVFATNLIYNIPQKKISAKLTNCLDLIAFTTGSGFLNNICKSTDDIIDVEGFENSFKLKGEALSENGKKLFEISGNYIKEDDEKAKIFGNFTVIRDTLKIPADFDFVMENDNLTVKKFNIYELVSLKGDLNIRKKDMDIKGTFNIDISQLRYLLNDNLSWIKEGLLRGDLEFSGNLESPTITGDLILENIIFNGDDKYYGSINFTSENGYRFKLGKAVLLSNSKNFARISGFIDFEEKSSKLKIKSEDIRAEQFFRTFITEGDIVTGNLSIDAEYNYNKGEETSFSGILSLKDGQCLSIPYQDMKITLFEPSEIEDSTRFIRKEYNSSTIFPKRVIFGGLNVLTKGNIKVQGNGYFPTSGDEEIDFKLSAEGDLLSLISNYVPTMKEHSSTGGATVFLVGNYDDIGIASGNVSIKNGKFKMTEVLNSVTDLNVDMKLNKDTRFVEIANFSCKIDRRNAKIGNVSNAVVNTGEKEIQLIPFVSSFSNINLGVLYIESSKEGIPLHIPSYMREETKGNLIFEGLRPGEKFYIAGPEKNPYIRGLLKVKGVTIQIPFESEEEETEKNIIEKFLSKSHWDVQLKALKDNEYYSELPITLEEVASNPLVRFRINENSEGLHFNGILNENEFYIEGNIYSSRGSIEYLNDVFNVEKFQIQYNKYNFPYPNISGIAKTVKRDTSIWGPINVFLEVYTEEGSTYSLTPAKNEEEWNLKIKLYSDHPNFGENLEKILALFGYSSKNILGKTTEMLGFRTSKLIFNPIFRPIERTLSKWLTLDEIMFRPHITGNLLTGLVSPFREDGSSPLLSRNILDPKFLLRSSEVRLGKYFSDDLYVSYTTALTSTVSKESSEKLGLSHLLGLEYKISPSLFLETQLDYNYGRYQEMGDKRIFLRYVFPLTEK